MHWREHARLEKLRQQWYGRSVGDGADKVSREQLDPWQRFAYDVVCNRSKLRGPKDALRLFLLGSAGTGKSRTVRSFVGACRDGVREEWEGKKERARLRGASAEKLQKAAEDVEERVRHACQLAAPTGCASFQLKFGASTVHRIFGVPVRYCGPWKDKTDKRYQKTRTRMQQARLFVMDEMSMIGRQMLGKVEFKVRDVLGNTPGEGGKEVYLGGRDTVLAGDPKQCPPIGDEPLYTEGAYRGKGQNKPRGSDSTPHGAWSTQTLVGTGMFVRNSFKDVVELREVHRYDDGDESMKDDEREKYREEASEFLRVVRGMADCTWTPSDWAWLSRRNRSALQQTAEGRKQLREFDGLEDPAPLLMDGRKDRQSGEKGAIRINQLKLNELSSRTGKPIAPLCAYHGRPDTKEGEKLRPEQMDADDFRGLQGELLM